MQPDQALVAIGLIAAILLVVYGLVRFLNRGIDARLEAIYQERTSSQSKIVDRCMVRDGYREEPAVAQLSDDRISIWTVTDQKIELPLNSVTLNRVRRNNWFGRYPWWGKTLLYIQTQNQDPLILGLKDARPWIQYLGKNSGN